jgi:acyl carrier protein
MELSTQTGETQMLERVVKLVSEATKIEADKIKLETSFIDDLNLDSLDIVELMMKMEDEFGVEIPEEQAEKLKTVGDVVKYLQTK